MMCLLLLMFCLMKYYMYDMRKYVRKMGQFSDALKDSLQVL